MSRKGFAAANAVAVGALGRGDLATARAAFTHWASSRNLVIRGLARHNLGWTLILEGRLEEAVRLLEDTAGQLTRALIRVALLPTTRVDAALCHALLGDLDRADVWCAQRQWPSYGYAQRHALERSSRRSSTPSSLVRSAT